MQSTTDRPEELADLERAAEELDRAEERVEAVGEPTLREVADAVESFERLLARYRERATGTGDFKAFVEFEEQVTELVEDLPEDLPERDAFEAAEDHLEQRRLSESDFERAHELVAPARELSERLDDRVEAREQYRSARRGVRRRRRELDDRIDDLAGIREFGRADLDAPVERLRDPIEAYDEAVRSAFETYKREASARDVLSLVTTTRWYPLVGFREPPDELHAFVADDPAGEEPIQKLLEYADYSRSKLSHYVDDARALKRAVATERTYLERLGGEPLTVGWPPPAAGALPLETREYESVARRFAPVDVLEKLRTVRRLPVETDYERLREAAVAHEELSERERRRLDDGEVEAELERLRARRDELADALSEYPER